MSTLQARSVASGRRGTTLVIGLGALLTAVTAGVATAAIAPSWGAALAAATGLTLTVPIVVRMSSGRFDVFSPIVPFVIGYGAMFVLRPAYMLATGEQGYELTGVTIPIGETFTQMQFIALLGALAFVFGYEYGPAKRLARSIPRIPDSPVRVFGVGALVVLGLGAAASAAFVVSQGGFQVLSAGRTESYFQSVSGGSKYLYIAPTILVPAAVMLFAVGLETRRAFYYLAAAAAVIALFAARGPVGSRIAFLPLIGGLIVYAYLRYGRRPSGMTVLIALAVGVLLSAFIGEVRNAPTRQETGAGALAGRLLASPVTALEPITEGQDVAMAPALAAALTVVPEATGYTYGFAAVGDLVVRPVPRSVWPGKPDAARQVVVTTLWPVGSRQGSANPEFSTLFPWYVDGGYLGVVLGLAVTGLFARTAVRYARLHGDSMPVRVSFAIFLPSMLMVLRDSPPDAVVRLVFLIGPVVAVAVGAQLLRARRA